MWSTATQANVAKISEDSLVGVLAKAAGASDIDQILIQARKHQAGLRARLQIKATDSPGKAKATGQTAQMRQFIERLPPGSLFYVDDLKQFGSTGNASQLLESLIKNSAVIRVRRGAYRVPGEHIPLELTGKYSADLRNYIFSKPLGSLIKRQQLLEIAPAASTQQVLAQLEKKGALVRVRKGQYVTQNGTNSGNILAEATVLKR